MAEAILRLRYGQCVILIPPMKFTPPMKPFSLLLLAGFTGFAAFAPWSLRAGNSPAIAGSAPVLSQAIAQNQSQTQGQTQRQSFHIFRDRDFHFFYPSGYRLVGVLPLPPGDPSLPPRVRQWEIWKGHWNPRNSMLGTEGDAPQAQEELPRMTITLHDNPQNLTLEQWPRPLAVGQPQVITVGGQGAIAYRATGLYESDQALVPLPQGNQVLHLQVTYLDGADPSRQMFQEVLKSLSFNPRSVGPRPPEPDGGWGFDPGEPMPADPGLDPGTIPINPADLEPKPTPPEPTLVLDLSQLTRFLTAQDWERANLETQALLMARVGSDYFYPHLGSSWNRISCGELRAIDALWSQASGGKFGFQAQWQQLQKIPRTPTGLSRQGVDAWAIAVGWRLAQQDDRRLGEFSLFDPFWKTDLELTPSLNAPTGHYPWYHINQAPIQQMMVDSGPGCGSCTVDAMYLGSDRFYDGINALAPRFEECFCD